MFDDKILSILTGLTIQGKGKAAMQTYKYDDTRLFPKLSCSPVTFKRKKD